MAEIYWWAWLATGLFITITSAIVGGTVQLFVWIGLLFIIIGIAKVVLLLVLRPKETKIERKAMHMPVHHAKAACPRCRVSIERTDYFCRYCGTRLR